MTPKTELELSELIKGADKPLRIVGGGTRQQLGSPTSGSTLNTTELYGISLYEPGALTVVAKAGTPVHEIEAALDGENQQLPFEPMSHQALFSSTGSATIGGVVACNISGPRRIQAGACRDSLIGVRFVDGSGNIIKNGGRVMKNVTGYDLVKLMAGSFGTLGVLTEVAFKVLPKPETNAMITIHGLADNDGIAALSSALGSPNDVTGVAHVNVQGDPKTYVRIEGFKKSVAFRTDALKSIYKHHEVTVETKAANTKNIWASIRDVEPLAHLDGDIWRISTIPTDGPKIVAHLHDQGVKAQALYDWGGGLVWLHVAKGTKLRAHLSAFNGHAMLVRGSAEPAFHPQNKLVTEIEQGLRQKFDPKGIFNPGIMG